MLRPSHPSWLDHSNYTWRRVQVMMLLIMQFSPTSCLFKSLNINKRIFSSHRIFKFLIRDVFNDTVSVT
jgi:hypothetical protein